MLSLVGIIVGLALLIFLAFRGKSLLWAAPVCALLVAFTGGLDMFTAYTQNYMEGMVGFVKEWFPAFMLGAIFGQIMQDSGGAVSLTKAVVKLVGRDKAIFASVLCGGVLAYGGISGFVIIFSMYPIVLGLFKVNCTQENGHDGFDPRPRLVDTHLTHRVRGTSSVIK
mgnify:CR=1 FL=1